MRDAVAFGPIAPQDISPERLAKRGLTMSEDCLTLNIWTPAADDNRRPVLVFLHGGGQAQGHGSAPLLDGSRLARRGDIVVVTMNFRLGVLGALYAPDWHGADSTNLTLRDQRHALQLGARADRRVRRRPRRHHGGGAVLRCDRDIGLARRRVRPLRPRDPAERRSGARPLDGGCVGRGRAHPLDRRLAHAEEPSVEEILAAQRGIDSGFVPPQGPFHPCIDGDVIAQHPLVAARTRAMPAIPILAGTTRDEWRIFDAALDEGVFTEQYVRDRAQALAGEGHDADAVVATYRADQHTLRDVASAMVTDYHFTAPTEQFVRAHAERGNAAFRYELQWPSPRAGLGACHDSCLPLLFGNLDAAPALVGDDDAARQMSDTVQELWLKFVRGEEPWERYDGVGGATMLLGRETGIARGHRAEQLAIWEKRYPAYG